MGLNVLIIFTCVFAKIKSLIIISVFIVELCHTMNINNNLSANVIMKYLITSVILHSNLFIKWPIISHHCVGDCSICLCSHAINFLCRIVNVIIHTIGVVMHCYIYYVMLLIVCYFVVLTLYFLVYLMYYDIGAQINLRLWSYFKSIIMYRSISTYIKYCCV